MDGQHTAVKEFEAVIVAVILLGLPAETHLERHGGQFSTTRSRHRTAYLRCRRRPFPHAGSHGKAGPHDDVGQTDEKPVGRTLFGHPIGLVNLFGVELWERFSFYGMMHDPRVLPHYSVTEGGLELPKATATGIVGAYGGLVYLSTVLGGWIADRVLGMERTVFYGGAVVMRGHIALAILPGLTGVGVGLVLVALGSGALKANASSLLGTLYEKGDPRRRRLHAVLPRHQPRRVRRAADHRTAAVAARLPLGLRRGGGRHGARPRSVRGLPTNLGSTVATCPIRCRVSGISRLRRRLVAVVAAVVDRCSARVIVKLANLSQVTTGVIIRRRSRTSS